MFITEMFCPDCQKDVKVGTIAGRYPPRCGECQVKFEVKQLQDYLDKFSALPNDDRLLFLAKEIYNIKESMSKIPSGFYNLLG